jgi:hypothetical protein
VEKIRKKRYNGLHKKNLYKGERKVSKERGRDRERKRERENHGQVFKANVVCITRDLNKSNR